MDVRLESRLPVVALVVPCYNEAERLNVSEFSAFAASNSNVRFVFVNDGSADRTLDRLAEIRDREPNRVDVLDLEHNVGKAEAVRNGLLRAIQLGADFVGYWDADLATPLNASTLLAELLMERPSLEIAMGSRVLLLGRAIERRRIRHYAGRVFATAASIVLDLPVYDTQCGAKLFRSTPRLRQVLARPFKSRWVFDVEIIARFGVLSSRESSEVLRETIYEFPLHEWRDVDGSKVRWRDFFRAMIDLLNIHLTYRSTRSRAAWAPQVS